MNQLSKTLKIPPAELTRAPKAEWHHDTNSGEHVWFYDPGRVYEWVSAKKRRKGK